MFSGELRLCKVHWSFSITSVLTRLQPCGIPAQKKKKIEMAH